MYVKQLSKGEKINWNSVLLQALGSGIYSLCLPGSGKIIWKVSSFFGKKFPILVNACKKHLKNRKEFFFIDI